MLKSKNKVRLKRLYDFLTFDKNIKNIDEEMSSERLSSNFSNINLKLNFFNVNLTKFIRKYRLK